MDILKIMQEIGQKYGIDPDSLEAGAFKPSEMVQLSALYQQWQKLGTEECARLYIEQKAKYIKARK